MKVPIIGGCGFIGGHLSELLVKKGHKVVACDELSMGALENVKVAFDIFVCAPAEGSRVAF